jgi:site-specific recombinase XerD
MARDETRTVSLVRDWLNYLSVSKALAPKTVALYRRLCSSFVEECVGDRRLEQITTAEIETWLQRPRAGRARGRTAAPATLHRDASTMRGFYRWLHAVGEVRENPADLVCTPVVHNRQPRPVSDAIFCRLWDALDGADAVVLGLAFFCGLRREEITRLRRYNVDVGRRKLVNFVRKGGGEDTLPIGTMLTPSSSVCHTSVPSDSGPSSQSGSRVASSAPLWSAGPSSDARDVRSRRRDARQTNLTPST